VDYCHEHVEGLVLEWLRGAIPANEKGTA
jgi:hypothetical protein